MPNLISSSRWLQLPIDIGLTAAQCIHIFHLLVELMHLMESAFGRQIAMDKLVTITGYKTRVRLTGSNDATTMLVVLALSHVAMFSNLLIMGIISGCETFVSHLHLENYPDQPDWLNHVNASVLKVKLATTIIGISSIQLLKTFINAARHTEQVLMCRASSTWCSCSAPWRLP